MAGTLFGIPMSQRVDANGDPEVGWLLYIYQANTSTPTTSYRDTALTLIQPWPLVADSWGMMPAFWLADGSYRARGTTADGMTVFFDEANILAIGGSTTTGPVTGADPNAVFQVGDLIWLDVAGPRAGWVRDNGKYIGSATSGADERANDDCQPLFEFLWLNYSGVCPVLPSRGTNALADWTANKRLQLPDKRGFVPGGVDGMGNTATTRYNGVPVVSGDQFTVGSVLGEALHTLSNAEMPQHNHTGTTGNQSADHTHSYTPPSTAGSGITGTIIAGGLAPGSQIQTGIQSADHHHTFTSDNSGSSQWHNNTQYTVLGTFYRKL